MMPSLKLGVLAVVAPMLLRSKSADAACEGKGAPVITWAETSNRIYVVGGCATIQDIFDARSDKFGAKGPLFYFDKANNAKSDAFTGVYYMEANVFITDGATLEIDGKAGDRPCETLLLASDEGMEQGDNLNIRAYGGNLIVRDTKVFSWDINKADHDMNPTNGRAHLSAVTEFITGRAEDTCPSDTKAGSAGYSTGAALKHMGVARMDIFDSELAYLGYYESESYGVSYKARGLCKTLENLDIFDDDHDFPVYGGYAVYGDIYNSKLHHNWFGHYSYGHQGGKWIGNEVHDNVGYGFDPHDDSDHLVIQGNKVWNNGHHGIIASKRCTDITITDNEVWNNADNGIMLHRQCDRATISGNVVYDNGDAGLALYESSDCTVHDNKFENNIHGIRWSQGANRNSVYENTIKLGSDEKYKYALYLYAGNDEPEAEGNPDGHPRDNEIFGNDISTGRPGVWKTQEADDNQFHSNTFNSGSAAEFVGSTDNLIRDNTFVDPEFEITADSASCFAPGTDVPGLAMCSSDGAPATPAPATAAETFTCDGVQNKNFCCPAECGECGGKGCSKRGFGLTASDCCTSKILAADNTCSSSQGAPCIVRDAGYTPSPVPTTDTYCDGVQNKEFCCPAECGECGGAGCRDRGSGLTAFDCCTSKIQAADKTCSSTQGAPCIIRG